MKDNIIRLRVGWEDVIHTYQRRKRWVLPHLLDRLRIMRLTRFYLEWEAISAQMAMRLHGHQYRRRGRRGLRGVDE
jgi:hypothetical protein